MLACCGSGAAAWGGAAGEVGIVSTPAVVAGAFGVRLSVPEDWTLAQDQTLAAVWRTPAGDLVLAAHLPEPIVVDAATLEDYRQDLRRIAAARGGGLLGCELHPKLGVVGVTKEPRPGSGGVTVVGRALVPTAQGHLALTVVAHEDGPAGAREAAAPGAGRDPYGFQPPGAAPPGRWSWPSGLLLAAPSDDAALDERFPEHPLTRARALLALLRARLVRDPVPPRDAPAEVEVEGARLRLPPGFLAAEQGRLAHGQVFRRVTFEKRVAFLTVCRHPGRPDAGADPAAARDLVLRHLEATRSRATLGPEAHPEAIADHPGVRCAWEAVLAVGGREHPTAAASFFLRWPEGEGGCLEVSCFGERDDWARADAALGGVVASLERAARPSVVPDTARLQGEVTQAGRRRVYRVLCHLAGCDGVIDAKERAVLDARKAEWALTPEEAAGLEAEGLAGERLDLGQNATEQRLLLDAMVAVVAADGCLDHEEQRRVLEIAAAVGLPVDEVKAKLMDVLMGGP